LKIPKIYFLKIDLYRWLFTPSVLGGPSSCFACMGTKLRSLWQASEGLFDFQCGDLNGRSCRLDGSSALFLGVPLAALRCFFAGTGALRLEEVQSKSKSYVKTLAAQLASDRVLQQGKPGKISKTHTRCPEFWSTAVGAVHKKPILRLMMLYVSNENRTTTVAAAWNAVPLT
jgi:hypothetical protein